jgi:hypothetical protein
MIDKLILYGILINGITNEYKVVCFEGGTATIKQLKPSSNRTEVFYFIGV